MFSRAPALSARRCAIVARKGVCGAARDVSQEVFPRVFRHRGKASRARRIAFFAMVFSGVRACVSRTHVPSRRGAYAPRALAPSPPSHGAPWDARTYACPPEGRVRARGAPRGRIWARAVRFRACAGVAAREGPRMGFASFLSCVLRNARGAPRGARATRPRGRMRRRLAACPWFASGVARMRLARVSGGRLAVGFDRDGKQACARRPQRLGTWARRAVWRTYACSRRERGRMPGRPGVSLHPVWAARRSPPAAFVPCVFERPRLPCRRPRACAGLAAPVQPHACPAARALGLSARRASSVRKFCPLSSDGACERAAPRTARRLLGGLCG